MKIKTYELTGAALDWAVAKCEGYFDIGMASVHDGVTDVFYFDLWTPSNSWSQAGPIIERERIALEFLAGAGDAGMDVWIASIRGIDECSLTPLIAAMRCYVTSKLGDEVEIPEELK